MYTIDTIIKKIERLTSENYHTESVLLLAKYLQNIPLSKDRAKLIRIDLERIKAASDSLQHTPYDLYTTRNDHLKNLLLVNTSHKYVRLSNR